MDLETCVQGEEEKIQRIEDDFGTLDWGIVEN